MILGHHRYSVEDDIRRKMRTMISGGIGARWMMMKTAALVPVPGSCCPTGPSLGRGKGAKGASFCVIPLALRPNRTACQYRISGIMLDILLRIIVLGPPREYQTALIRALPR